MPSPSPGDMAYLFGLHVETGGFDLRGGSLVLQTVGEDFCVKQGPWNRGGGDGRKFSSLGLSWS